MRTHRESVLVRWTRKSISDKTGENGCMYAYAVVYVMWRHLFSVLWHSQCAYTHTTEIGVFLSVFVVVSAVSSKIVVHVIVCGCFLIFWPICFPMILIYSFECIPVSVSVFRSINKRYKHVVHKEHMPKRLDESERKRNKYTHTRIHAARVRERGRESV